MDLRQIQYFVALVEEESITKAARRLHVVQPAVSMQIRRLEADFGLVLFERTPQGVLPNAIAKRVYPMCLEVLDKAEAIRAVLREGSGRVVGRLSVGIPPSFAQGVMARALISFRDQSPDVQVAIHEGYSANLVDWLVQGDLDFAVLSNIENEKRLRYQPLATEELMLVTGAETKLGAGDVRGADVTEMKLIVPSAHNLLRILLDAEFERAGVPLRPAMEVDSLVTVFGLLRSPGWATILPQSAAREDGSQGDLRWIRLVEPSIRRTLVIASLPQREPSAAAQILIGHLNKALHVAAPGQRSS